MKRIVSILGVAAVCLSGCEDLERELVTDITAQQVNKSYDYTLYRITSLYTDIPAATCKLMEP